MGSLVVRCDDSREELCSAERERWKLLTNYSLAGKSRVAKNALSPTLPLVGERRVGLLSSQGSA